jgi:hypothetical protein
MPKIEFAITFDTRHFDLIDEHFSKHIDATIFPGSYKFSLKNGSSKESNVSRIYLTSTSVHNDEELSVKFHPTRLALMLRDPELRIPLIEMRKLFNRIIQLYMTNNIDVSHRTVDIGWVGVA